MELWCAHWKIDYSLAPINCWFLLVARRKSELLLGVQIKYNNPLSEFWEVVHLRITCRVTILVIAKQFGHRRWSIPVRHCPARWVLNRERRMCPLKNRLFHWRQSAEDFHWQQEESMSYFQELNLTNGFLNVFVLFYDIWTLFLSVSIKYVVIILTKAFSQNSCVLLKTRPWTIVCEDSDARVYKGP